MSIPDRDPAAETPQSGARGAKKAGAGGRGQRSDSRATRQRETRETLLIAARQVFATDGYHLATLDAIAAEAGFSKGAIYSNFTSKAELFLAVFDDNLSILRGPDWDPLATEPDGPSAEQLASEVEAGFDIESLVRGFALATLEFIATAARDDALLEQLRSRLQLLLDSYARRAAELRSDTEALPVDDLARLLAALDQGVALLALSGITEMGGSLMSEGIRRIVNPAAAARGDLAAGGDPVGAPASPKVAGAPKSTERADASDSLLDVARVRQHFHEGGSKS